MNILWQRLILTGFGRFEGPVTVEFEPGLNVLIAPNEQGKSTLFAGLAAVLFGLPASSDETQFGQGKLRNWNNPVRFEGELHFARGEDVYRVRRQFENHRVTVSKETPSGWEDVLTGEHNPRARRRNPRYDEFLHTVVGIDNVELFWSAFAFGSPLPEADGLDQHIQELLSGAGAAHYMTALETLQRATFGLTKFSKDLGVADRDRMKDGQLERLQAEEQVLAARIEATRDAVDERQQVQRRLNELQQERKEARGRRQRVEAALEAWTGWDDARNERRRALAEQSKALQAWDQFTGLTRQLEDAREQVALRFPEFVDDDGTLGDKLEQLRRLEGEAQTRDARRRAQIGALVARGTEKLEAWHHFLRRREQLSNIKARLTDEFGVFEHADESSRQGYAKFDSEKERLARARERARERLVAAQAAAERLRIAEERRAAEREKFAAEYGDLDELNEEDALAAVTGRLRALARRDELLARQGALFASGRESSEETGSPGTFFIGGFSGAAVLAAIVLWIAGPWAAAGAFVAMAVAVFVVGRRKMTRISREQEEARAREVRELAAALAQVEAELAPDPRLGHFARADAHDLGVLSQRLAARRQAAAALEDSEGVEGDGGPVTGDRVPEADVAAAKGALWEAEADYEGFLAIVRPGLDAFGEEGLPTAYAQWVQLRSERKRLEEDLRDWVQKRFGGDDVYPETSILYVSPEREVVGDRGGGEGVGGDEIPGPTASSAGVWRQLARIAVTAGAGDDRGSVTVADVVKEMSRWKEDEVETVVQRVAVAETEGQEDKSLARLRDELAAPLVAAEGDSARALERWQQFERENRRIEQLRARQAGLLSGQGVEEADELHVRALDFGNRAEGARRRMDELRAAHPDLPDGEASDDGEYVAERLTALRDALATERAAEERAEEQYRELLHREAMLSGTDIINIAAAELELARLSEERRQIQFEAEATALAYRELAQAAESYEGTHRDVLAEGASRYVERFTGRARRVVLDEQFQVKIQDPEGPLHSVAQLSQGARDQLYLALRLAISDLVAAEASLPLLLDDPFVHCDEGRLLRIRQALDALDNRRQIVLFSHRSDLADWGHPVVPQGEGWEST